MVRRLSVIAALAASLSALPAGAAARSPTETPILFVHGWNPFAPLGYSCSAYWADMEHALRTWGWTGPLVTIKYYKHDTQCDVSVADANQETSIESIGRGLAWYVYDRYTTAGQTIDLVGHSMGGLVIRAAMTGVDEHDPSYPPSLLVDRVVTLESPHGGTPSADICPSPSCKEMRPGSSFLASLSPHPDGTGGTRWTVVGSYFDELVPGVSAVDMDADVRIVYRIPRYEHNAVLLDARSSDVSTWDESDDGAPAQRLHDRPESIRETFLGLTS